MHADESSVAARTCTSLQFCGGSKRRRAARGAAPSAARRSCPTPRRGRRREELVQRDVAAVRGARRRVGSRKSGGTGKTGMSDDSAPGSMSGAGAAGVDVRRRRDRPLLRAHRRHLLRDGRRRRVACAAAARRRGTADPRARAAHAKPRAAARARAAPRATDAAHLSPRRAPRASRGRAARRLRRAHQRSRRLLRCRRSRRRMGEGAPSGAAVVPDTRWTSQAAEALNVRRQPAAERRLGAGDRALPARARALADAARLPAYVIYNNLGWSMYHLGEWTSAEEHYRHRCASSPAAPPTDHAYINLATLHKAERRVKPTIKAYRAAVSLTHQSPTWAQLGWALMLDFKVEEAVHTLEDALSYRGESAPAAQETHNYLGFLYSFRRDWASASTHFVKAVDLGLPSNATGCRAGRWAVSEGWSSGGGVTVHPIAWTQVRRAVTFSDELQQQRAVAAGRAARPLYYPNASEFVDEHTGATHADAAAGARARAILAARILAAKFSETPYHTLTPPPPTAGAYKLVELKGVSLEGKHPSSLWLGAPDCVYFTGEHTASGFLPWDFGVLDREQNGSYNRPAPFEVRTRSITAPTFGARPARRRRRVLALPARTGVQATRAAIGGGRARVRGAGRGVRVGRGEALRAAPAAADPPPAARLEPVHAHRRPPALRQRPRHVPLGAGHALHVQAALPPRVGSRPPRRRRRRRQARAAAAQEHAAAVAAAQHADLRAPLPTALGADAPARPHARGGGGGGRRAAAAAAAAVLHAVGRPGEARGQRRAPPVGAAPRSLRPEADRRLCVRCDARPRALGAPVCDGRRGARAARRLARQPRLLRAGTPVLVYQTVDARSAEYREQLASRRCRPSRARGCTRRLARERRRRRLERPLGLRFVPVVPDGGARAAAHAASVCEGALLRQLLGDLRGGGPDRRGGRDGAAGDGAVAAKGRRPRRDQIVAAARADAPDVDAAQAARPRPPRSPRSPAAPDVPPRRRRRRRRRSTSPARRGRGRRPPLWKPYPSLPPPPPARRRRRRRARRRASRRSRSTTRARRTAGAAGAFADSGVTFGRGLDGAFDSVLRAHRHSAATASLRAPTATCRSPQHAADGVDHLRDRAEELLRRTEALRAPAPPPPARPPPLLAGGGGMADAPGYALWCAAGAAARVRGEPSFMLIQCGSCRVESRLGEPRHLDAEIGGFVGKSAKDVIKPAVLDGLSPQEAGALATLFTTPFKTPKDGDDAATSNPPPPPRGTPFNEGGREADAREDDFPRATELVEELRPLLLRGSSRSNGPSPPAALEPAVGGAARAQQEGGRAARCRSCRRRAATR